MCAPQRNVSLVAASNTFYWFATAATLLGLGTAMVYPTLLAAIGDVVNPSWRASTIGVYRLWRDLGYAAGALLSGVVADRFGVLAAVDLVAACTFISGALAAWRMNETLPCHQGRDELS
jgi:MFS family permease